MIIYNHKEQTNRISEREGKQMKTTKYINVREAHNFTVYNNREAVGYFSVLQEAKDFAIELGKKEGKDVRLSTDFFNEIIKVRS